LAIFEEGKMVDFIVCMIILGIAYYCLDRAKKGKLKVNIQRISTIDAIDEGIDRCVEMGRPVMYYASGAITGTGAATAFALLDILDYVAKRVATADIDLNVVVSSAIGLSVTRDTIREAYLSVGHPERYNSENVRYWAGGWTATYAARLQWLYDTKPGTYFSLGYLGWGGAMLSHDIHKVGATLIGGDVSGGRSLSLSYLGPDVLIMCEELYGTSAYLSKNLIESSVLLGGDYVKIIWIALILLGAILPQVGQWIGL
jgi:hypothetical protein